MSVINATREGPVSEKQGISRTYPLSKAETSCVYSRWIYGNDTAHLITWVRNSALAKAAYSPCGQVQHQGYRLVYGISLAAVALIGLSVSVIRNFLAICSLYYLGKRIWEYKNSTGPFATISNKDIGYQTFNAASQSDRDPMISSAYNSSSLSVKDSRQSQLSEVDDEANEDACREIPPENDEHYTERTIESLLSSDETEDRKKEDYARILQGWLEHMRYELCFSDDDDIHFRRGDCKEECIKQEMKVMKRLYAAYASIYEVEDPFKIIRAEIEERWQKQERKYLSDRAIADNSSEKSCLESVFEHQRKKEDYKYLIDLLNAPIEFTYPLQDESSSKEVSIVIKNSRGEEKATRISRDILRILRHDFLASLSSYSSLNFEEDNLTFYTVKHDSLRTTFSKWSLCKYLDSTTYLIKEQKKKVREIFDLGGPEDNTPPIVFKYPPEPSTTQKKKLEVPEIPITLTPPPKEQDAPTVEQNQGYLQWLWSMVPSFSE